MKKTITLTTTLLLILLIPLTLAQNQQANINSLARFPVLTNRTIAGHYGAPDREIADDWDNPGLEGWFTYTGGTITQSALKPSPQTDADYGYEAINSSVHFSSADDYMQDTDDLYFSGTQQNANLTIMAWFKESVQTNTKPKWFMSAGQAANNIGIHYDDNNNRFGLVIDNNLILSIPFTSDTNTWNHIAFSFSELGITAWQNWTNISYAAQAGPLFTTSRAILIPYREPDATDDEGEFNLAHFMIFNSTFQKEAIEYWAKHNPYSYYPPNITYVNSTVNTSIDNGSNEYECEMNFSHLGMPVPGNVTILADGNLIYTNQSLTLTNDTFILYRESFKNTYAANNITCRVSIHNFTESINMSDITHTIEHSNVIPSRYKIFLAEEQDDAANISNFTVTVDGISFTTNTTHLNLSSVFVPIGNHSVSISANGYISQTQTIEFYSIHDETIVFNLTKATFGLYFMPYSNDTWDFGMPGRFLVGDTECTEKWDCKFFNGTYIHMNSTDLSEGEVIMVFNPTSYLYTGWWQSIGFINDRTTPMNLTITTDFPDLALDIFAGENSLPIENAQICVEAWLNGTNWTWSDGIEQYWTSYCDLTDQSGIANLIVNDDYEYRICAHATNYYSNCIPSYVIPLTEDIYKINLESIGEYTETSYRVSTNCPTLYNQSTNCSIQVYTPRDWSTLCVDVEIVDTYAPLWTICSHATGFLNFSILLDDENQNYTFNVTLYDTTNEYPIYTLFTEYYNVTYAIPVNYRITDSEGITLIDRIEGNTNYLTTIYVMVILLSIIIYWLTEKYFPQYGLYGVGMFLLVFVQQGFIYFLVPVVLIGIRGAIQAIKPLLKT